MMLFDPWYFLFIAPAVLLALWRKCGQNRLMPGRDRIAAPLSGAAAARHILDAAGLQNVAIEMIPGELSDHYDPREKCSA